MRGFLAGMAARAGQVTASRSVENATTTLDRAIERHELPTDCDLELCLDHMIGALYFRVLVRHRDLDGAAIQRLADGLVAAMAASRVRD